LKRLRKFNASPLSYAEREAFEGAFDEKYKRFLKLSKSI